MTAGSFDVIILWKQIIELAIVELYDQRNLTIVKLTALFIRLVFGDTAVKCCNGDFFKFPGMSS